MRQTPANARHQTEVSPVDRLHRSIGNRSLGSLIQRCGGACKHDDGLDRMLSRRPIGVAPKLAVSRPGDLSELEADQATAQVMRMPTSAQIQRKCPDDECKLHRSASDSASTGGLDAGAIHGAMEASSASTLDSAQRSFFEPRFGSDFGHVRVHNDQLAQAASAHVNARAFTYGSHIFFGWGEYRPNSPEGRHLLAHELAHVVQQGNSGRLLGRKSRGRNSDGHGGLRISPSASAPHVQRLVRTGSVACPAAAAGIPAPHTGPADRRASALLTHALARIDAAIAARPADPTNADVVAVGNALHTAFGFNPANNDTWTLGPPNVRLPVVRTRVKMARDYIDSVVFNVTCEPVGAPHVIAGCPVDHCGPPPDSAFSCHANPTDIVLCPHFWALNLDQRGRTWLHEQFHIMFRFIDDWGQPDVHNAHCYAQFVALLNGFNSPVGFRCH